MRKYPLSIRDRWVARYSEKVSNGDRVTTDSPYGTSVGLAEDSHIPTP
jgi:hypothetical protein